MSRLFKKHKSEIGQSPDLIVFRGELQTANISLSVIDYDEVNLEEKEIHSVKEVLKYSNRDSVTWFNIDGLHDTGIIEEIASEFKLEKLLLAEVMDTQSRANVQEYDEAILVSIKMLKEEANSGRVVAENLSLILTDSILITFQEKKGDVFEPVRERIRKSKRKLRISGTDYLLFALLDVVVDNYLYNISILGDKIDDLEGMLLGDPEQSIVDKINFLKKELNFIRKNINPARDMILFLSKIDTSLIKSSSSPYFKDLLDNINHATEVADSYREILSDQLSIYHTKMSTKLNDIMKFLTVFSAVFIPLTFIAGIYGTNFDFLPELHYQYSYFIMWGVIIILAVAMLLYFRNKKWL